MPYTRNIGRPASPAGQAHAAAGFTLVELLVVIGIIGLLIAILLPALGASREKAFEIVCASNQKQLASATLSYAADNGQYLPQYLDPDQLEGNVISSPIKTYRVAYTNGGSATDTKPTNHGRLYGQGYVDEPDVFYCPQQKAALWQPDGYPDPWLSAGSPGQGLDGSDSTTIFLVRSSYMFNPHPINPNPLKAEREYVRVPDLPLKDVLLMDLLIGSDHPTIAHGENDTWNIAFPDGHVSRAVDEAVSKLRNNGSFPSMSWAVFKDFKDKLLESVE